MNTVTRSGHFLAVLALAAAASGYWYVALYDENVSDAQIHYATAAIRADDPAAMDGDSVFGRDGLWRLNLPLPQWALQQALSYTSYGDLTLPFRAAVGPIAFIYLLGMYALIFSRCRSWPIALFVSLMSSKITYALGGAFWGAGSLASATPQGLLVACTPWIVMAFLKLQGRRLLPLVFLVIGLLGNVHPVGAANLTAVLVLTHLLTKPLAGDRWLGVIVCIAFAAAGAMPAVWRYVELRASLTGVSGTTDAAAAMEVLQLTGLKVLYGDMLRSSLRWLATLAVLVVPACAVLIRSDSGPVKNKAPWIAMIVATLVVSLGLHSLCLLAGVLLKSPPPAIDFLRASALLMLPLYVFFADMLKTLFNTARAYRILLRGVCLVLLAIWLIMSDNLRNVRYQMLEAGTVFMDEADKPNSVQRHRDRSRAHRELVAIAHWVRNNSAPQAVLISESIDLRMCARRSIVASADDARYVYYLAPNRLGSWSKRIRDQRALLAGPLNAADVRRFIDDLKRQGLFTTASQWYVVVGASPDKGDDLQEIINPQWGRTYRLFLVP